MVKIIKLGYLRILEYTRTVYNKLLYMILYLIKKIFKIDKLTLFQDSNGWSTTFRYDKYIYKFVNIFTFLNPFYNIKHMKELNSLNKNYIPKMYFSIFYIKITYIYNAKNLLDYLLSINTQEEKLDIFLKLFNILSDFHNMGYVHNDLKPKNIIRGRDGNLYLIDLESVSKSPDKIKDYNKLIPRIIYFLDNNEFKILLEKINDTTLKDYLLNKYATRYNIFNILKQFNFIEFEKNKYSENEDIDIVIPAYDYIHIILNIIEKLNVDYQLFTCCKNDIKLFIYNQEIDICVDIHLSYYLNNFKFIFLKLFKNINYNFYITGPDGSGKSTLISFIKKELEKKGVYKFMYINTYHANRFVRKNHLLTHFNFFDKILCKFFSCIIKKVLLLYKLKITKKNVITIYDRSLFDQFIWKKNNTIMNYIFKKLYIKKTTFLLKVSEKNILYRKKELSKLEIQEYYENYKIFYKEYIPISNDNLDYAFYQIKSIIRYIIYSKIEN